MSRGLNLFNNIVCDFIYIDCDRLIFSDFKFNFDIIYISHFLFNLFMKPLFSRSLIHFQRFKVETDFSISRVSVL